MSQLLPAGCRSLRDAPYTFSRAVLAALRFLSFEEMLPDDVPPRNIWLDSKRLREHFEQLKLKHREGSRAAEIEDPVRNPTLDLIIR